MSLPLAAEGARPWRWLLGLAAVLALAASVVLAASFGEMPIAPLTSLQAIANGLGLGPYPVSASSRASSGNTASSRLVAACCGAGLAVSGAIFSAAAQRPGRALCARPIGLAPPPARCW